MQRGSSAGQPRENSTGEALPPRTISDVLAFGAQRTPDAPALVAPGRADVTYVALREHVAETGNLLRSAGIGRSDTVAVIMDGGPAAAATFLAVGAVAVCAPLNPLYTARELEFYLDDLGAQLVVVPTGGKDDARSVARSRGIAIADLVPNTDTGVDRLIIESSDAPTGDAESAAELDDALVLHTSGTTARPKIVSLTHGRLMTSAASIATALQLGPTDRCLNVMPLFHIHGLVAGLLAPLSVGGSVICPARFDGTQFVTWLEALEPTWYTAVPTMHQSILARLRSNDSPRVRHRLRFARSSSAPLPVSVLEGLEAELGVPMIEAYGMTEAAHQITSNPLPPGRRLPGTVGIAAGPEVSIVGDDGDGVPPGTVGEVIIRGDNVFQGYTDNPEANDSAFVRGWFRTGDLGVIDHDGYLRLRGRIKEIINRGGEKISPAEIDDVLLVHPAVEQSVTFGIPDSRLGEEVAAAVIVAEGYDTTERELQDFVAQTLAPFKVPRRIELVDEIPKGPTGKVQRIGMHERLGISEAPSEDLPHVHVLPETHLESELIGIWEAVLGRSGIGLKDDFFALGGDSILGAEAVARIREMTGRPDLPLITIVRAPTPEKMVAELLEGDDPGETLVEFRSGATGTPLFLTHGGDLVVGLPALASRLSPDRTIFGLRPRLDEPPSGRLTIDGVAAELVAALREARPHGPYALAGICSGGPIVLEMARLLEGDGDQVELVVLVDPRVRSPSTVRHIVWRGMVHARHGSLSRAVVRKARHLSARRPSDDMHLPEFYRRLSAARDAYDVRPLPGIRAALISTMDYEYELAVPRRVLRTALPDGFESRSIPFRHGSLMFPPAIDALASELDQLLDLPKERG